MHSAIEYSPVIAVSEPATVTACPSCGETVTPAGKCLNIGSCDTADADATRGARRETAKSRVAAWTLSGGVD